VNPARDITEFLSSRRARITPEQAGLPTYGPRRVPGLRREEVASLAGVSVEYYRRLERGHLSGVSDLVPLFDSPEQPANSARFTFLDPTATEFYVDWDRVASDLVAYLRSEAGPNSMTAR
jgi:transcriptional regulator with XRE-family HTH domain